MKRMFNSEQFHEEEDNDKEKNLSNYGVSWRRGPLIGKGGFGSVYLANLKKPKSKNGYFPQVMAIKSAQVSSSTSLQKEKEVFEHLHGCPYILGCYGEETTTTKNGEMIYNVLLEYASGGTLADLIKKSGHSGLPESDVRRYTRCILKGIDYIHSHGYVHCDLKPDNVLLVSARNGDSFVPKIGDFGLAKKFVKCKKMKFDPDFGGTALYMAPETVTDHIQQPPCDIWALGCIVFEMLTGNKVWDSNSDLTTHEILKKISDRYELPKIPPHISKDGKDFLKCCLVRKPMFRFTAEMLLIRPFVSGGLVELSNNEQGWVHSHDLSFICEEAWSIDVGKNNMHDFLDSAKPEVQLVL
ncbi:mitogen-activated protein kinase kinase kinase 20-like [Euphorbia lathyris]|uniref:mitogen-activated protein kinase kinase kinase 20-like n=1 Tax=Euphorbia lathyris TaxID=212925 RepID=UPI0033135DAE